MVGGLLGGGASRGDNQNPNQQQEKNGSGGLGGTLYI